jgi:hypothetical protein
MKIYVATMEVFNEKERHDEIQFITKIDGFMSFLPLFLKMAVKC